MCRPGIAISTGGTRNGTCCLIEGLLTRGCGAVTGHAPHVCTLVAVREVYNHFSCDICIYLCMYLFIYLFIDNRVLEHGSGETAYLNLHDLYNSQNIIRTIKSRIKRWVGHVARMGVETEISFTINIYLTFYVFFRDFA
jgi:hypothetical protein